MASTPEITMDLLLYIRIDEHMRTIAVRAGKMRCRSEQAADQRAFRIDLASAASEMRATQVGKCGLMIRDTFDRKPCHFFGRGGNRPTAIVTSRFALEGWNMLSEIPDLSAVFSHSRAAHQIARLRKARISFLDFT